MTDLARVVVTRYMINIYSMLVCAVDDATDDEILACCNRYNPAGTSFGWARVVRDPLEEDDAGVLPIACEAIPGRTHFIVTC